MPKFHTIYWLFPFLLIAVGVGLLMWILAQADERARTAPCAEFESYPAYRVPARCSSYFQQGGK